MYYLKNGQRGNYPVGEGGVGWGMGNLRSGVFCFSRKEEAREKKIAPSFRERHKGIIGRGHDLRLGCGK